VTSLWAFLFVLGVLIFVHELGHFLMARRIGVRVLTFSLGFGPKLLKYRRGDTEYCISAIPLGGYVKMAGEHPDDVRSGSGDEFLSKTKWQRFQVLIMGPLMNILLAVVVMAAVLYQPADVPAFEQQPPVVGSVVEGSPAERAGIQPGDRILRFNGQSTDTWEQLSMLVIPRANREVEIEYLRDGEPISARIVPEAQTKYEIGNIGVEPIRRPQVRGVLPGQPAERAGLRPGDVIVGVEGEAPIGSAELLDRIKESEGRPLTLSVLRAGEPVEIVVTPELTGDIPMIGVELSAVEVHRMEPGLLQALGMSVQRNYEISVLIFRTIGELITGRTSMKQLMGPVAIAELSGGAAQAGWIQLFTLMALISLNLGILNLLPIPVLDGGHIAIMALEGLARRDFSMRVKEKMLMVGFVLIVMLMVTVIYNDLARTRWFENLIFWR
jgi:regulator of sigma E protease